ncbi:MAG: hypothetical protein D6761_13835 [Candidatus Dadabacteria bacterium]|nr:MAG: hypothetical protein D6761_13835 [Candidatus Dadabacteria bacterium]
MKLGKLVSLGVMVGLGWQHQEMVRKQAELITNVMPLVQTYVEMESMKGRLASWLESNNYYWPRDVRALLNSEFKSSSGGEVGVDFFGAPYEGDYQGPDDFPVLRSCGPDLTCGTDDDLVMKIFTRIRRR